MTGVLRLRGYDGGVRWILHIVLAALAAATVRAADDPPGTIVLDAKDAKIENNGGSARYETAPNRLCIGYWGSTSTVVRWSFEVTQKAAYRIIMVQACGPDSPGSRFEVLVGNQRATGDVETTGDWGRFVDLDIGPILLRKPGTCELSVRGIFKPGRSVMNLRAVKLVPEK